MNLTEKAIVALKPGKKRTQHMDSKEVGFGVRVDPDGRKSFLWFKKINGVPRFRALGEFPITTVGEARNEAERLSGIAAEWKKSGYAGDDPFLKIRKPEPSSVPTFQALVDAYIENHVKLTANHPDRAAYNVRHLLKRYLSEWAERPIDRIGIEDVLKVKNACGAHRFQANRLVEFTRAIFSWSARSRDGKVNFWDVSNPAKGVETFPEKRRERYLQPAELVKFGEELKKEEHPELKDVLTLALATGARKWDIFSMRWQDILWEQETWRVPFPKNAESYDVQLLPAALEVLKRRRASAPEEAVFVFPANSESGHIIDVKKPWIQFRKRAGIPDVRLHDLRRTVGSYQAISGVSLQQIGASLGHRSLQSTQVYAKLHSSAIRDAREAGQAKMIEMMKAAKRRQKSLASGKKPKMLRAANA